MHLYFMKGISAIALDNPLAKTGYHPESFNSLSYFISFQQTQLRRKPTYSKMHHEQSQLQKP